MIWRLFKSKPDDESIGMAAIIEDTGLCYVPLDYRDMGVNEGWLRCTGYFRDSKNRLVWTYVYVRR